MGDMERVFSFIFLDRDLLFDGRVVVVVDSARATHGALL